MRLNCSWFVIEESAQKKFVEKESDTVGDINERPKRGPGRAGRN